MKNQDQKDGTDVRTEFAGQKKESEKQERMDKTLADSYPASDPPSSIPDPSDDPSSPADKEDPS